MSRGKKGIIHFMDFSWHKISNPFFVLAPMEGATDTVFRQIVFLCGKPDIYFTEFTNVEGLISKGFEQVTQRLKFTDFETPIIAQLWGINPDNFYESSKMVSKMGFAGIDINMGCPERTVVRHGACSGLIKTPELAKEIIEAVKKGSNGLPISVKTRIGFSTIQTDEWILFLLKQNLDALTVHFRTSREMSLVPAHWEEAIKIVKSKNTIAKNTVLIGNGDVETVAEGKEKAEKYGLDGIMIGRGVFHNPFVFNPKVDYELMPKEEKIKLLLTHLDIFEETWKGEKRKYDPLKRFFKIYIQGFDGAAELREILMQTKSIEEAREVLEN